MDRRERVARALCQCDEQDGGPPWDWYPETKKHSISKEWYRERADAALAAADADTVGKARPLEFGYINWRGEYANRRVHPIRLWHGSTEYHPSPQWLLKAFDLDKDAERDFALCDMTFSQRPNSDGTDADTVRVPREDEEEG